MKKLSIVLVLAALSPSVFALTPFNTVEQAEKYCPASTQLTFVQTNPKVQNGAGYITGSQNNVNFTTSTTTALHPMYMDSNNIIEGASFRETYGMFGYINDNLIICFYSYTGFTGDLVYPYLQGQMQ